jgi:hypothetical protein
MINKKSYNNISIIILYIISGFILANLFFFYIFGNVSVDTVIALSLLLLFYFFYFFGNKAINNYLYNQTKVVSIFFSKLLYLTISLRMLLLSLNKSYFYFLKYKILVLNHTLTDLNFYELKIDLLKYFNINNLYKLFTLKLNYISIFNKYIIKYNNFNINYNIKIVNFQNNCFLNFFIK